MKPIPGKGVSVTFPLGVIKYLGKRDLRGKGLILARGSGLLSLRAWKSQVTESAVTQQGRLMLGLSSTSPRVCSPRPEPGERHCSPQGASSHIDSSRDDDPSYGCLRILQTSS